METNKIVLFILSHWKDIGMFCGAVWGLFIAVKKMYYKAFLPLKIWVKKVNDAADQLQFNGGTSTKDMVQQIRDGQRVLIKKVDILTNKQMAMVELNDMCLFENDPHGKCIKANAALCLLFGASQNQMLGYGWLNFIKDPDHERVLFESAIESDNEITRPYTILYGMDKHKEIEAKYIAHIKRDADGGVINVMGKVIKL